MRFAFAITLPIVLLARVASAQHPVEVEREAARGNYLEALTVYDRLAQRSMTTQAHIAAGKSAWALSLPETAMARFDSALLDKALSLQERAKLILSKGILCFQEGNYQTATLHAEKLVSLLNEPSSLRAKGWLLWGESLSRLNQHGQAEAKYRSGLAESSDSEQPEASYLLAMNLMTLGKNDEARSLLETIPMENERSPAAMRNLAMIALDSGQFQHAEFWISQGRELFPDSFLDSWADYILMRAAIQAQDIVKVRAVRERAEKKFPASDPWLTLLQSAAEVFEWQRTAAERSTDGSSGGSR